MSPARARGPDSHRSFRFAAVGRVLALAILVLVAFPAAAADPLAGWHPIELEWLVRFQGGGEWAGGMRAISALGPGSLMAALVALVFFAHDPRLATRLGLLMFGALWLRELLALALQSPRPFWIDPRLQTFGDSAVRAARFGLPSGHALVAAAFWFRVAMEFRRGRPWVWGAAVVLVAAIAVSRLYLGVHFVSDVVLGVAVGSGLAVVHRRCEAAVGEWYGGLSRRGQAGWALGIGLAMGFLGVAVYGLAVSGPAPAAWGAYGEKARTVRIFFELGGTVFGVGLGLATLREWSGAGGPWWQRVLRVALAGAVVKWGLRDPLAAGIARGFSGAPEFVRCAVEFASGAVQAWAIWGGLPRVFLRCGWARGDGPVRRADAEGSGVGGS